MSVYFITAREVDRVKIGYAFNPVARFRHLSTSSPIELALEGAIPGGREKEREMHQRFAKWRVRGEWFTITPSIEAAIEASTRPTEYTWGAVRIWLAKLEKADEERERQATPQVVLDAVAQRIQEALDRSAERKRMTELERREADGDICFPFRAEIPA